MTTRMKSFAIAIAILALVGGAVYAQNTANHDVVMSCPYIMRLDVSDAATPVTLAVSAPLNAGDDPIGSSDSGKTLQYTVVTNATEIITVQIDAMANILAGCSLAVDASAFAANEGATAGPVTFADATAHNLITGIQSVATGAAGPTITFTLAVTDPTLLVEGASETANILYTLVL